jgi:hypothetical protein
LCFFANLLCESTESELIPMTSASSLHFKYESFGLDIKPLAKLSLPLSS